MGLLLSNKETKSRLYYPAIHLDAKIELHRVHKSEVQSILEKPNAHQLTHFSSL